MQLNEISKLSHNKQGNIAQVQSAGFDINKNLYTGTININSLLEQAIAKGAADLHLAANMPAMVRIDRNFVPLNDTNLGPEICKNLVYSVLTQKQIKEFEEKNELDLAFSVDKYGRVRMNVFRQKGFIGASLRLLPKKIKTFAELNLPAVVNTIVNLKKGLVLVTGATGSGKTTTLASIIDYINEHRRCHIITIEDPIEFVHFSKKSIITQREVGADTENFQTGLKYVLRQSPDVILIGEMRDIETISSAITLAETGHLVFATLHTNDTSSAINRIVDAFPAHQQAQVRSQLSLTLRAVFAQQLIPHISGKGMVLCAEIMLVNDGIKNVIREMKPEQIYLIIQTNKHNGMQTMNQSLVDNIKKHKISPQVAMEYSIHKEELVKLLNP